MWITSLDSTHPSATLVDAAIEVLVEPRLSETEHLAALRVTIPPGAAMRRHSHGESEALLVPLAGEMLLVGIDGRVERLAEGTLAVVAAHERVIVENPGSEPASMLVCLAPATFVETLSVTRASAVAGASW